MTKSCLAIPAGSFLLFVLLLPACAQTNVDNSQRQVAAAGISADQPGSKMTDEDLARLYLIRKQYREAQDLFHKLTLEQPKNAVYWNELGISFHNQAELASALKCYHKSSKLDSHYADAVNNAGTVYYERKKYSKAIHFYKRAIQLRQDYAAFYLNLGYAYFGQKDYANSITAFRKALELDPETFDAGRSRAGTVIQDRTVASDRAQFYFLLAKSFAQSGNADRCLTYLKKAREEGYKDINTVKSDPAFAVVIKDPAMQDFLQEKPADTTVQQ
jgi:tetratricopeptide (TPR) repeat protein